MKIHHLAIAPLLLLAAAAPAFATQGYSCRTTDPEGVRVTVISGTGAPGGIALVTLREGQRIFSTGATGQPVEVSRSALDNRTLTLDLVDPQDGQPVARVQARRADDVSDLDGTLEFTGRVYRLVCSPDQ